MGQTKSTVRGDIPLTSRVVSKVYQRHHFLGCLGNRKKTKSSLQKNDKPSLQKNDNYVEEEDSVLVDMKHQNDFRTNFIRKLLYEKVWVPNAQRSLKQQTILIFDWDDTLLCTSFLYKHQDQALSDVVQQYVQEIGIIVKKMLESAMRLGQTFIITNAMNGWVEYSAARWVPDLLPVLQKVNIISARSKYEPQFPGDVNQWKIQAFLEVQQQFDSHILTNLISFGDSNYEMEAVQIMGKEFVEAFIKTVKFLEKPSPKELLMQLQLVSPKFERIVEKARNWTGGACTTKIAPVTTKDS